MIRVVPLALLLTLCVLLRAGAAAARCHAASG